MKELIAIASSGDFETNEISYFLFGNILNFNFVWLFVVHGEYPWANLVNLHTSLKKQSCLLDNSSARQQSVNHGARNFD